MFKSIMQYAKGGATPAAIVAVVLSSVLGYGAYVDRQLHALAVSVAELRTTVEERSKALDRRLDDLLRVLESKRPRP
jgi:hypothetical protein